MAVNTLPIAIKTPKIQRGDATLTTANTGVDGTGAGSVIAFTANATNPSICHYLILKPYANAAATTATALRVFVNDGAGTAAANYMFVKSVTLAATTEAIASGTQEVIVPLNLPMPPGYKITATIATGSANGWQVTGVGGDT
jgi:hypothetical protein